jgi:hypothetical protein
MAFFFLLIFSTVLLLSIPLGICWLLYRWLKRKGHYRSATLLPSALVLALGYFIYTVFYPDDSFYADEFQQITGHPLPTSAEIEAKDASYPDQHGDYAACARIKLSPADYHLLAQQVSHNTAFQDMRGDFRTHFIYGTTFENVNPDFDDGTSYHQAYFRNRNAFMFIGFLRDGKTIIMYRSSS